MLTVHYENTYDGTAYSATVSSFGREYAVTWDNERNDIAVRATWGANKFMRMPAWKREADLRKVREFAASRIKAAAH